MDWEKKGSNPIIAMMPRVTLKVTTADGEETERTEWVYDDRKNRISVHYYAKRIKKMQLQFYFLYTYDKANRLVRKDNWSRSSGMRKRWDCAYVFF